ncbi:short-chain dehydrogenase/reductase SDR [Paenibacillus curdlanolyticus YK9]|uniref:Short-chain dehydrogenase/reductase SDR n=1 Tax=Paenibacillus curdlanolyticus YK9 TaxID=717606 RepID=E0I8M4_9BACL|nr:SDR family oxidoreductase [Paenibacillus curdlanolyticus]EFM11529.1 short-chain dehydrogenase/reductase SDR [Paenibacillus curdlanolyticus YK9]
MNKRAIVTGATRGIGRMIAVRLIELGYFVEFTFIRSFEEAERLEQEYPGKCRGAQVDCRSQEQIDRYVQRIVEDGDSPVTVLINNAGITYDALVKEGVWEDFEETIATNLGGPFHFCHALIPHLIRARRGDIIMISSLASDNVRIGNAFYGTTKAALNRLSETLAAELARLNVAVNIISPGYVETELIGDKLTDDKRRELLREIPLRRFTTADEVADGVEFLLGRKPLLIGANLPLGGGGHLR